MLTAMVVLAAVTCTPPKPAPARTIQGVFVEMNGEKDENGQYPWVRVLKSKNVREIIIANIRGYDKDVQPCWRPGGCDKTEEALAFLKAVPTGVAVYVGLVYDAQFSIKELSGARKEDRDHAVAFWKAAEKQGLHERITGWYLGREWHNFSDDTAVQNVHAYLDGTSADLVSELPQCIIAVAPFWRPSKYCGKDFRDAVATGKLFAALLHDTDVNLLVLQDVFAERTLEPCTAGLTVKAYADEAATYEREVKKALPGKVRFAVDLEAFAPSKQIECRLDWQFHSLPSKDTPVFVYEQSDCLARKLCQ